MRPAGYLFILALPVALASGALLLSVPSWAVQDPRISLDMDPTGNTYDAATNTMSVGSVDSCLAVLGANPTTHAHTAHLIVENVEDLVGWQARLNYNGDEMRPAAVDFGPFLDTTAGQEVSFVNLPKVAGTSGHREIVGFHSIPSAASGPQSALIGAVYNYAQNFDVSPDTPAKNPPDDSSYSAPNGGVLAALNLEVAGDQSGQTLFMQVDDSNPNGPGSAAQIFNGYGLMAWDLPERSLFSGFHAEGAENCAPVPTPTDGPPTPSPGPTPTPVPPAPVADIEVTAVNAEAPQSAVAGEPFDIRYTGNVMNRGPDGAAVQLLASYAWDSAFDCFSAPDVRNLWELGYLGASAAVSFDITNGFTCYGTADSSTSGTMYLRVGACPSNSCAFDPDRGNNDWERQSQFSVIGSAPVPTEPVVGGPTPTPILPTPTPGPTITPDPFAGINTPTPTGGAPLQVAAADAVVGATGVAGGQNSADEAEAVLAARGLPSTGKQAPGEGPAWAQFLITVVALGLPTAAGVSIHRRIARRR